MTTTDADAWAETVLAVLATRFPYGSAHVSRDDSDVDVTPERLHPAFWGCLDWHSSVHMQWSALRLMPHVSSDHAERLRQVVTARWRPDAIAAEAAYLREHPSYERPYGWGWALLLSGTARQVDPDGWGAELRPLTTTVRDLLLSWLSRLVRPIRHGVHSNTAFALALAHRGLLLAGDTEAVAAVAGHAVELYGADTAHPTSYEPSGEDFLSPALAEADLMRRVLPAEAFGPWLTAFLPGLGAEGDVLLEVPAVRDPADGRQAHLYGLALSRAAHLRGIIPWIDPERAVRVQVAADRFVADVGPVVTGDNFMATHWLVSFALLAQDAKHALVQSSDNPGELQDEEDHDH